MAICLNCGVCYLIHPAYPISKLAQGPKSPSTSSSRLLDLTSATRTVVMLAESNPGLLRTIQRLNQLSYEHWPFKYFEQLQWAVFSHVVLDSAYFNSPQDFLRLPGFVTKANLGFLFNQIREQQN